MTPVQDIGLLVGILSVFILILQERHYSFLMRKFKAATIEDLQKDVGDKLHEILNTVENKMHNLEVRFDEIDDYKNKVDALILKAGFKL